MKNLKLPSLVPSLAVQTLALSGLVASVMFAAKPAQAATFTASLNGTTYNITTVTGSYNSLRTQLQATPWWNNQSLASSVASRVGASNPSSTIPLMALDPFLPFRGSPGG